MADEKVRPEIVSLLSPETDQEFEQSLNEPAEEEQAVPRTRKKRRDSGAPRKAKTITVGEVDERLERAKKKFSSLGGGQAIKKLFSILDKPLDNEEEEDVDDYFYLLSHKGALDPTQSWIVMILCAVILFGRLVGSRTESFVELREILSPREKSLEVSADGENQTRPM